MLEVLSTPSAHASVEQSDLPPPQQQRETNVIDITEAEIVTGLTHDAPIPSGIRPPLVRPVAIRPPNLRVL